MQDAAERAVLRLVSQRVNRAVEKLHALPWLPPGPPPPSRSVYVEDLVEVLQVRVGAG